MHATRTRRHPGQRLAAFGVGAILLLGGCASFAPPEGARQIHSGRFALNLDRDGRQESHSGRFTLAVAPGRTTLDFASPLGNTLARIEVGPDGAVLTAPRADGTLATWQGDNAEALVDSTLGFGVPVSGLPDWIAGRPVPGRPARIEPSAGPAQRIEQDGWVVAVDERFPDSGAPRRLSLSRENPGPLPLSLRLRLVIDAPTAGPEASLQ